MALNFGDILLAATTGTAEGLAEEQVRRNEALKKRIEKLEKYDLETEKTRYEKASKEYQKRKEAFTPIMAAGDNFTRNRIYNKEYLKLSDDESRERMKETLLDLNDEALAQALGEEPLYYETSTKYDTVRPRSVLSDAAGLIGMDVEEGPSTSEQIKKLRLESMKKAADRDKDITAPKFEKGRYTEIPDWAKEGFIWSETLQEWVAKPEPDQRDAADTSAREAQIRKNIKDNQRITAKSLQKPTASAIKSFADANDWSRINDLSDEERKTFNNAVNEDTLALVKEGMDTTEANIAAIKINTQGIVQSTSLMGKVLDRDTYNPENIQFTVSDLIETWKKDGYPRNPHQAYTTSLIDSVTTMQPTKTEPTKLAPEPTRANIEAYKARYPNRTEEEIIRAMKRAGVY